MAPGSFRSNQPRLINNFYEKIIFKTENISVLISVSVRSADVLFLRVAEVEGRQRVIIERVEPEIDGGRFPIKRTVGEKVVVEADIFADGHDVLSAVVRFGDKEIPMKPLVNDRWRGEFVVQELGAHCFSIEAWVNHFETWWRGLEKKVKAGMDVSSELLEGAKMLEAAAARAPKLEARELQEAANGLLTSGTDRLKAGLHTDRISELMNRYGERAFVVRYPGEDSRSSSLQSPSLEKASLRVWVEPELARFSAWYEMFPRSVGTFRDCEKMLPEIGEMSFDILY